MSTLIVERQESSMSKMGAHIGSMLMDAAKKYNTLLKTALEGIQNAIDAEATVIFVGFDLKDRVSIIADNGAGVTQEQFEEALRLIGRSQKLRNPGKLGQFGIGLISPLNKCKFFEFVSTPKSGVTRAWTFAQSKVEASEGEVDVPMTILSNGMPTLEATFEPEARKLGVSWNTMVRMYDITNDRVVSKLTCSKLADEIKSRFGDAMRTRNTVCHVFIRDAAGHLYRSKVEPHEYTGEPIDGSPFVITGDQVGTAGKITIELYRAVQKNGRRQGEVKISEGKGAIFGLSLTTFLAQARRTLGYNPKDSFEELNSGYFEGLIRVENLRLNSDRDNFLEENPFLDAVIALDSWYDTVGRQFYQGEKDRERDDRYRDLTNVALNEVAKILRHPDFEETRQWLLDNVQVGLIGDGHGEKPEDGTDKDRTTRTGRSASPSRTSPTKSQSFVTPSKVTRETTISLSARSIRRAGVGAWYAVIPSVSGSW